MWFVAFPPFSPDRIRFFFSLYSNLVNFVQKNRELLFLTITNFFSRIHISPLLPIPNPIPTAAREWEWRAPAPLRSQPLCDHPSVPPTPLFIRTPTPLRCCSGARTGSAIPLRVVSVPQGMERGGFLSPRLRLSRGFTGLRNDGTFFYVIFFMPRFGNPLSSPKQTKVEASNCQSVPSGGGPVQKPTV